MGISVKTEGGAIITVTPPAPRPITIQRPGVQGLRGIQGDAATIEVVSTTTLLPGSDATVENVGTPNDAKLAFGVPQGLRGPDGRVYSIIPGDNITVNDADPGNPVVSTPSDMATSVYDPQNMADDAFDRANHTGEMPFSALQSIATGGRVLGRTSGTGWGEIALSAGTGANSVAFRGTGGTLQVGTPTADNHASTKKYVDDELAGKFDIPTGTTSQYIRGDGSRAAFPTIPPGTVTSVGLSAPTGFSVSGSPVTNSGTLTLAYAAGYTGFTTALQTKLNGIAAGATANQSDAYLLDRANQTGTMPLSGIASPNNGPFVLGKVSTGSVAELPFSDAPTASTIARRSAGGVLRVGAPTSDDHAATKKYVDENAGGLGTAKAWVNFDGTGTVAIRDSYNVSSITDNGSGDYTVNFATAMGNANYAVALSVVGNTDSSLWRLAVIRGSDAGGASGKTTAGVRILTGASDNGASKVDLAEINVVVFGS